MVPRRLVVRALLRASGTATALVVLYFTLPLTGSIDRSTAMLLVLGPAGVRRYRHLAGPFRPAVVLPGPGAIESLAAAIPLFLVLFAGPISTSPISTGARSASR